MARYDLGLSDEDFGDLTYALFEALIKRLEEGERNRYLHTGILATSVINTSFCRPDNPVKVEDFVPKDKGEEYDLSKLSAEEQTAHVMSTFSKRTFSR